jgi:hypothetical protein
VADYWQLSLKIWRLGIYLKAKRRIMETCSWGEGLELGFFQLKNP